MRRVTHSSAIRRFSACAMADSFLAYMSLTPKHSTFHLQKRVLWTRSRGFSLNRDTMLCTRAASAVSSCQLATAVCLWAWRDLTGDWYNHQPCDTPCIVLQGKVTRLQLAAFHSRLVCITRARVSTQHALPDCAQFTEQQRRRAWRKQRVDSLLESVWSCGHM